ncbi:MAG: GNAT family N-acetyltransferase [Lachnospiraceae bacterium]|nr:GNAT family N-acetyltransferase [Lachnospiraceae bacterium]
MIVQKSKTFEELSKRELYEILKARAKIFVAEQHILYVDMDDKDYDSLHVFFEDEGKVVAYLRAFEEGRGIVRMGRVLTIEHGAGLGGRLLRFGIEEVEKKFNLEKISIDSQSHAIGFYEKAGFVVCSEEFLEEGVKHVKMELSR